MKSSMKWEETEIYREFCPSLLTIFGLPKEIMRCDTGFFRSACRFFCSARKKFCKASTKMEKAHRDFSTYAELPLNLVKQKSEALQRSYLA